MKSPPPSRALLVAGGRVGLGVRTGAQWAEIGFRIRQADHGIWTGVLLSIERRGSGGIETAGYRVFWVGEPEANMESVRRGQVCRWIEAKNLIKEDGLDCDFSLTFAIGLHIGLVPSQAKIDKVWVGLSISQQVRVLNGEKIEPQLRLEILSAQTERVVQRTSRDRHSSSRRRPSLHSETAGKFWLNCEVKCDLFYVLGERGHDRDHQADGGKYEIDPAFHCSSPDFEIGRVALLLAQTQGQF